MIFKKWKLNLLFNKSFNLSLHPMLSKPCHMLACCFLKLTLFHQSFTFSQLLLLASAGNNPRLLVSLFLWSLWDYLFSQLLLEVMHTRSFSVPNALLAMGKVHGTNLVPSLCYLSKDLLSKISFHSDNIFVLVAYQYSLQHKAHKASLSWAVKNPW